jgi:hypothetical protein
MWWQHWLFWLMLLGALASMPVLLHGCHGDEDNELFAPASAGF